MPKGLAMRIALAKEPGKLVYEMEREGKIEARGTAAAGDTIHLGWSKWRRRSMTCCRMPSCITR